MKVYVGIDPVSKKEHYLTETVKPGPRAAKEAEKVRIRLLNQVDERRASRTNATVNTLLDRWLDLVELEDTTRIGYVRKLNRHVWPLLGETSVGKVDTETLESFYTVLRRCREH